jgi:hypothetical protein
MDLPPIIPLFIAAGVFAALGAAQIVIWLVMALSSDVAIGRWVMLASSIAYSSIGVVFFLGARHQRERNHRAKTGRCLHCGYRLTGNTSGVCPECGRPISMNS